MIRRIARLHSANPCSLKQRDSDGRIARPLGGKRPSIPACGLGTQLRQRIEVLRNCDRITLGFTLRLYRRGVEQSFLLAPTPLSGPAIRQHYQLGSVRAVQNLDNVGSVLSLGEARGFVRHCLLIAKCARQAVVQDVEALVFALEVVFHCYCERNREERSGNKHYSPHESPLSPAVAYSLDSRRSSALDPHQCGPPTCAF